MGYYSSKHSCFNMIWFGYFNDDTKQRDINFINVKKMKSDKDYYNLLWRECFMINESMEVWKNLSMSLCKIEREMYHYKKCENNSIQMTHVQKHQNIYLYH